MSEERAVRNDSDIKVERGRESGMVYLRATHMTNEMYQIQWIDLRNIIDSVGQRGYRGGNRSVHVYIHAANTSNTPHNTRFFVDYDGKNLRIGCHHFSIATTRIIRRWARAVRLEQ